MARSFRHVFTLVVVAAATIPVLTLAYVFIGRVTDLTVANAHRELDLLATSTADALGHDLDRLTDQARTASVDSDVRRSVNSVLFLGRADIRLGELQTDNPIARAVFLLDATGSVVTAAPSSMLAQVPPRHVVDQAKTMISAGVKDDALMVYEIPTEGRLLSLVLTVAGAVGKPSGAILVQVPVERLLQAAKQMLPPSATVSLGKDGKSWSPERDDADAMLTASVALAPERLRAFGPLATLSVSEPRQSRFEPVRRTINQSILFVIIAVVAFAVIGYLLARRLLTPLRALSAQASDYAEGVYDRPRPRTGFAEFDRVGSILVNMAIQIGRNRQAERAQLEAELKALRDQMSPHFLFNTLNGLATMAGIDPERTTAMLTKLASLYRLTLETSKAATSPLARELEIVSLYLELESVRFGKRLRYEVATNGAGIGQLRLPGLILQTLVENAVKHGIAKAREGGEVRVLVEDVEAATGAYRVRVVNTGAPYVEGAEGLARETETGGGVGLDNTRKRLDLLYGDAHGFVIGRNATGETEVSFRIPPTQNDKGVHR